MRQQITTRFFLVLALSAFLSCTNQKSKNCIKESLHQREQETLDLFFRYLLRNTSLGFVLFGDKPAFTWGILSGHDSVQMLGDSLHQESVYLKKGLNILKTLPINQTNSEFLLLESPGLYEGWNEFWVIHRKNFEKVVNNNKTLFQYILGPSISAQTLLEELEKPNSNLTTLLRGDRVLMGIILGYGSENALVVSRYEYLMEYIQDQSTPLKLNKTTHDLTRGFYRSMGDDPSFNYASIQEEYDQLKRKTKVTIEVFPQTTSPQLPHFGFLSTPESEVLIKKYQKTQEVIQKQLQSSNLFETVLSKFISQESYFSPSQPTINTQEAGYTIGQAIWQSHFAGEENGEEIDAFLKGMEAREKEAKLPVSDSEYRRLFNAFNQIKDRCSVNENLERANHFFEQLEIKSGTAVQKKQGVYSETLWEGDGLELTSQNSEVTLTISVKNLKGKSLLNKISSTYHLSEIDQALSYALLGMKEREERRIYLHPKAIDSIDLTQNGGFIVTICLEKIHQQQKSPRVFPTLQELNSLLKDKREAQQNYQEAKNALYFAQGAAAWNHYMKLHHYSFQEVREGFESARKGKTFDTTNPSSEALLTEVHWEIYRLQ